MRLRTQLLVGNVLVLALLVSVAVIAYQGLGTLVETGQFVSHTHEVQSQAHVIEKLLIDMETGERGFLIAGTEEFLEPYETALAEYDRAFGNLRELVSDNPPQVSRLDEIDSLVQRWHHVAGTVEIEARREMDRTGGSIDQVANLIQQGTGKAIMDTLRDRLAAFVAVEAVLLVEREGAVLGAATATNLAIILTTLFALGIGVGGMLVINRNVLRQVGAEPAVLAAATEEISRGNLDVEIGRNGGSATGIAASIATMVTSLKQNKEQMEGQDWLKTGIARLNDEMRGELDTQTLCARLISEISTYLEAQVGAVYLVNEESTNGPILSLRASYAYTKRKNLSNEFKVGEGLVGQCALEKQPILVRNVPADYVKVTSGLGESTPRFISVTPVLYEGTVKGVIEMGTVGEISDRQLEYLSLALPAVAINIQTAAARKTIAASLAEAHALTEELQTSNEQLETRTQRLQQSEAEVQAANEELQAANEQLEEKSELLERQKSDVERARREIEVKAEELALGSKYKSEFLANMSHELRTPLNSLLLLAGALAANKDGSLSADQVESARIIQSSGSDLLTLINEILDLSKIEAGRMTLNVGMVRTHDLAAGITETFGHLADEKGLSLKVAVSDDAPAEISTDRQRLDQVIRNLMSNAIKFTHKGGITVSIGRPDPEVRLLRSGLAPERALAIAVTDTGIGIPPEQQKVIFEAFQQIDGSATRPYGGTGLGLSISRELAQLLGGEVQLDSELGTGSTFTLYVATVAPASGQAAAVSTIHTRGRRPQAEARSVEAERAIRAVEQLPDDRESVKAGDRVILVIEDDPKFAKLLYDRCRQKGFSCVVAPTGEDGLDLAQRLRPTGIILDLRLPGMDGWQVLDMLKDNLRIRHIPVHIMSGEEASAEAPRRGAIGHLTKPVDEAGLQRVFGTLEDAIQRKVKRLLVVEDDKATRRSIVELVGNADVHVDEAASGQEALHALRAKPYDCMILDLGLGDMDGHELLRTLETSEGVEVPPVVVCTAADLTREDEMALREHAESIILKDVRSQERLLDEVSLFLHQAVSEMPEKKQKIMMGLHETDALLKNKKVLIADDDMRTTFALSRLLADHGLRPLKAEDGRQALRLLDQEPDVDLVLMDIMMPVMDGYETIQKIRAQERFRRLPIIALTAKAMKADRERCLVAGANDYLPKPVNMDRLLSMMRVWLHR